MSVQFGLLALLTLGEAYGLQLRNELQQRTQRPTPLNVGQVYGSLERLVAAGLANKQAAPKGQNPMYSATAQGRAAAAAWLSSPDDDQLAMWDAMVFQVMLARSLPAHDSKPLVTAWRKRWDQQLQEAQEAYQPELCADLRSSATEQLCGAAFAWLSYVSSLSDAGFGLTSERPQRGRPRSHG